MNEKNSIWGKVLFAEICILVFVSGFLPVAWISQFNSFIFILIYLTCLMVISKISKSLIAMAIISSILQVITKVLNFSLLAETLQILNIIFFAVIVILLIYAIARAPETNANVIFEAINGYLLTGIMFAAMVLLLCRIDPGAFSFTNQQELLNHNGIYFSFVTLTTLGYGDLLPITPPAKSLAILIAVAGQLYLTVIIALLIGKYSNRLTKS